ncbi:DUF2690 domain-containing protein [Streptomyces sp. I05A-00742]|uniref:DUF2690 domain-containing protein n=1 Tax=Streptomyces sp. I05A-00742 TaxID=2732853 RepID=UPI0014889014|nr:DUF2690 domain-containing protein [Streptomyces sp. I05A-00742]
MNPMRGAAGAALAVGLAFATTGWTAPPASAVHTAQSPRTPADVGCKGPTCSGQDPHSTQCSTTGTVLTLEHQELQGRTINLRWSQDCQAGWAELTGGVPGDDALVQNNTGETQHRAVTSGTTTYSPMVNDAPPLTVRACVTLQSGSQKCTFYH